MIQTALIKLQKSCLLLILSVFGPVVPALTNKFVSLCSNPTGDAGRTRKIYTGSGQEWPTSSVRGESCIILHRSAHSRGTTKLHPLLQHKYVLLKYVLLKVALQGSIATLIYALVNCTNNRCKVATDNDGL